METSTGGQWHRQPHGSGLPVAACALQWRRVFPGDGCELSTLRKWLVSLLPDCPARSDVLAQTFDDLGKRPPSVPGAGAGVVKHLGATDIASLLESLCSSPRTEGVWHDVHHVPGPGRTGPAGP